MSYSDQIASLAARVAQEIKSLRDQGTTLLTGQRETRVRKNRTWVSLIAGGANAGTGSSPARSWQHVAPLIPAGRTITRFHLAGFLKDGDLDDLDLFVCLRHPSPGTAWLSGYNSDAQVGETILYQGPWTGGGLPSDRHRHRSAAINVTTLVPSYLAIYARAPGGSRKDDDFTGSWTIEVF